MMSSPTLPNNKPLEQRTLILPQSWVNNPPTAPTANLSLPSANSALCSTVNADQVKQDVMKIFSHILPGNTEIQAIVDKYTAATVTVKLGNESPTAILFDCNNPFDLDTCAEVSF